MFGVCLQAGVKSELQHSSGAGRASFGSEMLVLQALVCIDQHSRGAVTLWAHRVRSLPPLSSLGISISAPQVTSWWINGAWWGKTGLFTWLEVCDHGQGHCLSAGVTSELPQEFGSIWLWANIKGFSEEGGSGGILCAINTTGQWSCVSFGDCWKQCHA